jgi:hypothetical protein
MLSNKERLAWVTLPLGQSLQKVSLLNAMLDTGFFLCSGTWSVGFLLDLSSVFASCNSLILLGFLNLSKLDLSNGLIFS